MRNKKMCKKPNVSDSLWHQEGIKARDERKTIADCPYRVYTYGYVEWMRGFNEPDTVFLETRYFS